MTQSLADLCREAEELCRKLAPIDLADVPVYVVADCQTPPHLRCNDHCGGYTSGTLWIDLADTLGERFAGPGAAMVVSEHQAATGARSPYELRLRFLGTVMHELAHILERAAPCHHPIAASAAEIVACLTVAAEPPNWAAVESAREAVAHADHGWQWIRIVLHLMHRAERVGLLLRPTAAGETYGLSDLSAYRDALGDEPERMADLSFATIKSHEPPQAFRLLWESDTRTPTKETEQMANILTSITDAFRTRQAAKARSYDDLVNTLAAGGRVDPAEAAEVLDRAGKTADDLVVAVARLEQRRDALAARADADAASSEEPPIRARIRAEYAKLDAARQACRAAVAPLRRQLDAISLRTSARLDAERRLVETASPELHERQREIQSHQQALAAHRRESVERLGRAELNRSRLTQPDQAERRGMYKVNDPHSPIATPEEIRAADTRIAAVRKEIADLDAEAARLANESAAVHRRMLEA